MKKKSLRILSLIVAIVMVVAMLPLSALADEEYPTQKVALVVYSAEFTTMIKSAMEKNASLDDLKDIASQYVAEGSEGVQVPQIKATLTPEDTSLQTIELSEAENGFNLFESLQMDIPIVDRVNDKINNNLGILGNLSFVQKLKEDLISKTEAAVNNAMASVFKNLNVYGTIYRVYVANVPVKDEEGTKYTLRIDEFNGIKDPEAIQEGYVLYEGEGVFHSDREREEVIKLRDDDHYQFLASKGADNDVGLKGDLNPLVGINDWLNTQSWYRDPYKGTINDFIGKLTDKFDSSFKFTFPGLWCAESEAGFAFTDVDVAETGIAGSEYLLVNRDELIDVLQFMKELGKDAFQGALAATFGGTATYADGTVKDYDSIVNLYFELVKSEDGQLSLDYDTAFAILKTYLGVISDMNLFDRVVDTSDGDITKIKLKYPIPAFLQATSDENGIVKFNRNSNVTLTWMLQIIPQITEALGDASFVQDNKVLSLLVKVADFAAPYLSEGASEFINTLVYPFAQRLGLVGKKMASGNYIMFQTKAAEGYWINPLAYTMILTWENETWLYVTVADLGLIKPYFAAGFYDFVRDTTFAGTIDKFINSIAGKDVNIITGILDPEGIDITKEMGKVVTGALTAFVGQIGFESLGLDTIFSTKSEFVAGLNKYLYENGRTAQNLMIYVNKQAMRAKSVYAGYVTEDWYFYNIDKSPTTTATKLIDKSTKDLAAAFVNPTKSTIITKTGNTVKSIVGSIGYKVEEVAQNIRTQIKSTIGAAVKSVVQKAFDSVKTSITNFAKDMFSRLING